MKSIRIILLAVMLIPLLSLTSSNIKLKLRSLLDDRIELKIPKDFDIMSEELTKVKYPSENRPTLIYSNENGSINVALNLTENSASQSFIETYVESLVGTFENLYPTAEWKDSGTTEINGRKVGYLKLITPSVDTKIYNVIFFTDLDGKFLVTSFNCTEDFIPEWEGTSDEIMNSLNIK